jgi:hypothetical protein
VIWVCKLYHHVEGAAQGEDFNYYFYAYYISLYKGSLKYLKLYLSAFFHMEVKFKDKYNKTEL